MVSREFTPITPFLLDRYRVEWTRPRLQHVSSGPGNPHWIYRQRSGQLEGGPGPDRSGCPYLPRYSGDLAPHQMWYQHPNTTQQWPTFLFGHWFEPERLTPSNKVRGHRGASVVGGMGRRPLMVLLSLRSLVPFIVQHASSLVAIVIDSFGTASRNRGIFGPSCLDNCGQPADCSPASNATMMSSVPKECKDLKGRKAPTPATKEPGRKRARRGEKVVPTLTPRVKRSTPRAPRSANVNLPQTWLSGVSCGGIQTCQSGRGCLHA